MFLGIASTAFVFVNYLYINWVKKSLCCEEDVRAIAKTLASSTYSSQIRRGLETYKSKQEMMTENMQLPEICLRWLFSARFLRANSFNLV